MGRGFALTSLLLHEEGELLLCGDYTGTLNLLSLSEGFYMTGKEEKTTLSNLFEMEKRREKILELRFREIHLSSRASVVSDMAPRKASLSLLEAEEEQKEEFNLVEEAEKDFFAYINEYKAERERKRAEFEKQQRKKTRSSSETDSATVSFVQIS